MQQVLWVGAVGLSVALCAWFVLELDGRRLLGSMRAWTRCVRRAEERLRVRR